MYKILFITLSAQLITSGTAISQNVFQVEHTSQADVLIHYVDYRSSADIVIYYTRYQSQARQGVCNGVWYSVEFRSQADFTFAVTDYRHQADLLIYPADHRHQAQVNQSACAQIHAIHSRIHSG